MSIVLSLCDLSGNMVMPWVEAGYDAILVDPQHGTTRWEEWGPEGTGKVLHVAKTVGEVLENGMVASWIRQGTLSAIFAFPPCTDFAVSGARWFKPKYEKDPLFQVKAMVVAEQCRTTGQAAGVPYMIENPSGILSTAWGKPQHMFNPYQFTQWEQDDNYKKRTCLWTGNGFRMPVEARDESLGDPDSRILMAGESADRQNFRSQTPMGFARAVFAANH